jgi:hypothetical protein
MIILKDLKNQLLEHKEDDENELLLEQKKMMKLN